MTTLNKYKQNLKTDSNYIYSYNTRVASINHKNKTIEPLGWWSVTTSKHINYVGLEYGYKVLKK
tara:strand:- start:196 stop:387 length:192 start_codon:yes stop_codon:yes gene_type:complete